MKSIVLIVPYIGKWPFWFDAYLISIAKNPTINWLFITDCEIPVEYPENVTFVKTTQEEFNRKIDTFFTTTIPLTPRKICDLRPAFGDLFSNYLDGYDYWGYCDMDIVWGDIRSFISQDDLNKYDIISSRKNNTSGHFTIFKNCPEINSLYKSIPEFREKLAKVKLQRMDEDGLTDFLWKELENSKHSFKVKWDAILCNQENGRDSHQEYYLDKWLWKDGKMLELKNGKPVNEVMYLHFINWKRTMKFSEVYYSNNFEQFYISYIGIHLKSHSDFRIMLNSLKNIFVGYEKRMFRKRFFKKIRKKIRF
ncbi:MAG TPA: DUF6625 family protein [Vicingaceae bacterium]|nr:DUF6625 family protein [Vicingaceae bacterium]